MSAWLRIRTGWFVALLVSCELAAAAPITPKATRPPGCEIAISGIGANDVRIVLVGPGDTSFSLLAAGAVSASFHATSNHPSVVEATVDSHGVLHLSTHVAGRAGLKISSADGTITRHIGIVVKQPQGQWPGLPDYVGVGSVSEDTTDDLNFWWGFGTGRTNRFVDVRYQYLNGGPGNQGWVSWGNTPGSRARGFIRESQRLGFIPFFVFYNIPDVNESYSIDREHLQDPAYLAAYFVNLKLLLDIIVSESPDELVGIVFEPDLIGYMAQNSGLRPAGILAATHSAYGPGLLTHGVDPEFADTLTGLVQAINYLVSSRAPQAWFGWQMNLWASPTGGFTTPVPGSGLMHATDTGDLTAGRARVIGEATAITQYYVDAGITGFGAGFVSVDKYGFDATGANPVGVSNPAAAPWFWHSEHWGNYLAFAAAMHQTAGLPVVLWQLPVGHINHSLTTNPYAVDGAFANLDNTFAHYEDSAPDFFFGDTFTATGARRTYFAHHDGVVPGYGVVGDRLEWPSRMGSARDAGVVLALFGAGVGASTHNTGTPPGDQYWWITKAQDYLATPIPLIPLTDAIFANGFQ